MRADLLALTADDLAGLTNRGTVKRALRELEAGAPTLVEAPDGTVTAESSDATVVLPAGAPVEDARCTCAAVGLCRHVVRAVLAYAASAAADSWSSDAPWDPGALGDDALAAALRPAALRRGRALVERGVTATVVRSAKPMALLHDVEATVRFLVPDDLAYARCDCADQPPCQHVVAAVHAFRALPEGEEAGLVELASSVAPPAEERPGPAAPPGPADSSLHAVEDALALLAEAGVAGGTAVAGDLRLAGGRCRTEERPWLADLCEELADLGERHARSDAAFDPLRVAELVGETVLRVDALRAGSVPALFAGGPRSAAETEVGGGRLVGLGTRVRLLGRTVDVDALVYDTVAHRVLALGRTFVDPDDGPPRPFADLATTSLQRGIPLAKAASGQLIATGGKRSAGGRLRLGRRPAGLSAQRFEWDTLLRAPTLVEGVAEARGVRAAVPPPLGPRTAGAGLVVVPLAQVRAAGFHVTTQSVVAEVEDALGEPATLASPFHHRAAAGAEQLLSALTGDAIPRFVSGEVRVRGAETVIVPVALVVETPDGARRMVQPAVDRGDSAAAAAFEHAASEAPAGPPAVAEHVHDLQTALGELLVTGASRADRSLRDVWTALAERGEALGSVLLTQAAGRLTTALAARAHDPAWTPQATVSAALSLAATLELARTLS